MFYGVHVYCPFDGKCLKEHGSKTSHTVSRKKARLAALVSSSSSIKENLTCKSEGSRQREGEEKMRDGKWNSCDL